MLQLKVYESLLTIHMYAPLEDTIQIDSLSDLADAVSSKRFKIILSESDKFALKRSFDDDSMPSGKVKTDL